MAEEKIKAIVRLMNTDVTGETSLIKSLIRVHGIKFAMANAICNTLNYDKRRKIGLFNQQEIKDMEELIKNADKRLPSWLLNRRRDPETGNDNHIISAELKFKKDFDIKMMKKVRSYKGMRHSFGLPVRGQRTRAHFRHGKSVGVTKGTKIALKAAAKARKGEKK